MRTKIVLLPSAPATPTVGQLTSRIRQMAEPGQVERMRFDHPHFQQRLAERGVNMRHVLETVRKGNATEPPTIDQYGEWRIKLRRKVAGRRVQVVVAVKEDHFVVVTAI
ncbi:MAG: DUF4258 domain-containing protein [Methylocella sp.]